MVGLTIVATLPSFSATQVRAKMSRLATPSNVRLTLGLLTVATATSATGAATGHPWVAGTGLFAYAAGLLVVAALLAVYGRSRLHWAGPGAWQLLAGVGWWIAATVSLAVVTVRQMPNRRVLTVLVVGAYAQILVASLATSDRCCEAAAIAG